MVDPLGVTVRARTLAPFGRDPGERATMARGLAFLFAAGATLVAATIMLLPAPEDMNELGLWLPVTAAYATAAILIASRDRLGARTMQIVIAGGTLLITSCVINGGEAGSAYPLMYVWVALYAYYFFTLRAAVVQTILCSACYATAFLVTDSIPEPGAHLIMTIGTLAVAGGLIGQLTETARIQTADLAAVAEMGAVHDVTEFAHAVCEGMRRSVGAEVVALLEPGSDGGGLRVTGIAGASEADLALGAPGAPEAIDAAYEEAEPRPVGGEERGVLTGSVTGLAQPVVRDGETIGVLAVAWARPKRRISERTANAALLFASEAALAIERQREKARERERHALEINDNIVQGLVVAKYAAAAGMADQAAQAIDDTLARARALITAQLDDVGDAGSVRPGDLVRDEAARAPSA